LDAFCLPDTYKARAEVNYFDDSPYIDSAIIHQPKVYDVANYICQTAHRSTVIDIGCGNGRKLQSIQVPRKIGVDFGINLESCRSRYPGQEWVEVDLSSPDCISLAKRADKHSLVICADVIEHLADPRLLVALLAQCARNGAIVITSTPDRALVRGRDHVGPPGNPSHIREWELSEYRQFLSSQQMPISYAGHTWDNTQDRRMNTIVTISGVTPDEHAVAILSGTDFQVKAPIKRVLPGVLSVLQTNSSTGADGYKEIFDAAYKECPAAERILSFGCSTGEELDAISTRWKSSKITGVEIVDSVRMEASKHFPQFDIGSPENLSGSFDVIFAMSVLCRWPEVGGPLPYEQFASTVRSIDDHLKPGGLLVAWNTTYSPATVLEYDARSFTPDLLLNTNLPHRLIVMPRHPDGNLSKSVHPVFYRKPMQRGMFQINDSERIAALQKSLEAALTRVAALETSTSWTITAPLRFLMTQLRRLR